MTDRTVSFNEKKVRQLDRIPSELKERLQWVCSKLVARQNGDKDRKPPVNVHKGCGASTTSPLTWSTYKLAEEYLDEWWGHDHSHLDKKTDKELTGPLVTVGFIFAAGDPYVFIDLDECFDDQGKLLDWARRIVDLFKSYTEISISGNGLHIIIRGKKPGERCKDKTGNIECYEHARHCAVTGDIFEGRDTIQDRQAELEQFYAEYLNRDNDQNDNRHSCAVAAGVDIDVQTVLDRALASKQAEKIADLLTGDNCGFPSDSDADQSLCNYLVFYCGNVPDEVATRVIDQIVRDSGRYRKKWDEKRGERTYGQITIDTALADVKERYGSGKTRNEMMALAEQQMKQHGLTVKDTLKLAGEGQKGSAQLTITLFQDRFCYDHAANLWYSYHTHFWQQEVIETPIQRLDEVQGLFVLAMARVSSEINKIEVKIAKSDNEIEIKALKKEKKELKMQRLSLYNAIDSLNKLHFREQVLKFATKGPNTLGITGEEWDLHPTLLAVENGVLDLETGSFRAGKQSDYIKTVCPHAYDPEAMCPVWEKFLQDIFDNDLELVDYIQRLLGFCTSGLTTEHILPVFWGAGRNGKGTLLETLGYVLGPLAGPVQAEMLLDQSKQRSSAGPTSDIMALRGRRFAWASETAEGKKLSSSRIKWLTGGDTLVGRPPYGKREITFRATHKIVLMTNHKPQADADDFALWDRIHLVPFLKSFVDKPEQDNEFLRDTALPVKLQAEASGILAWLVHGFRQWREHGLNPPDCIKNATLEYQKSEDLVLLFLEEACEQGEGKMIRASAFHSLYVEWCAEKKLKPMTSTSFGLKMTKLFNKRGERDGLYYLGVGTKTTLDDDND